MEELSYLNHPTISPSFFDQQPGVDPSLEVTRSKSVPMPTARSHPHNLKCTPLSTSDPFSRTVPSSDHSAAASSRSWSPSKSSMKHNGPSAPGFSPTATALAKSGRGNRRRPSTSNPSKPMSSNSARVAAARKEVICQFYLEGKCRDGDACRFSHKLDPTRVCAYFREGNCKIGEKCLNLHPGESQPYRDNVWATYLARQHEQQQQQQEELVRVAELGALLDNLDMGATNVPQHHFTADETFIDISKLSRQEEQDLLELTVDLERRKRPRPLLTLHKINHRQEPDRWPRRYQTDSSLSSSPPSQRSSPSNYLPDFQHYPRYDWAFNDSSRDTDSSADVTDDELPFSIRGFDRYEHVQSLESSPSSKRSSSSTTASMPDCEGSTPTASSPPMRLYNPFGQSLSFFSHDIFGDKPCQHLPSSTERKPIGPIGTPLASPFSPSTPLMSGLADDPPLFPPNRCHKSKRKEGFGRAKLNNWL